MKKDTVEFIKDTGAAVYLVNYIPAEGYMPFAIFDSIDEISKVDMDIQIRCLSNDEEVLVYPLVRSQLDNYDNKEITYEELLSI